MRMNDILRELSLKNPIIKKSYVLSIIRDNKDFIFLDLANEVEVVDFDVRKNYLFLKGKNNYVSNQINISKNEIMKKINSLLKGNYVEKIILRR